jgi:hypothetical protein
MMQKYVKDHNKKKIKTKTSLIGNVLIIWKLFFYNRTKMNESKQIIISEIMRKYKTYLSCCSASIL